MTADEFAATTAHATGSTRVPRARPLQFQFGNLILDTGKRRICREGRWLELGHLTYALLHALVEAAPDVVSARELAERVWQRKYVSPGAVAQRVRLLRRALADDGRQSRYIEPVRGRGYRFKAQVRRASSSAAAARMPDSVAVVPPAYVGPGRRPNGLLALLHVTLIDELSIAGDLNVISRSSLLQYAEEATPSRKIAAELRVEAVVELAVHRVGKGFRLAVHLVDGETGLSVWSKHHEGDADELIRVQSAMASEVARVMLVGRPVRRAPSPRLRRTRSLAARKWYEQAEQAFLVQAPKRGFDCLDRAARIDPNFAGPLALKAVALARALIHADGPAPITAEATAAAEREALAAAAEALTLDPAASLSFVARAMIHTVHWRSREARAAFRSALEIEPDDATALEPHAAFGIFAGDAEAAMSSARRIRQIDPDNAMAYWLEGKALSAIDRHREALRAYAYALQLSPRQVLLQRSVGDGYVRLGRMRDAERAFRSVEAFVEGRPDRAIWLPSLAYGYAMACLPDEALRLTRTYGSWLGSVRPSAGDRALLALATGDEGGALRSLRAAAAKRALGEGDPGLWALVELRDNYLGDSRLERADFRAIAGELRLR